MPKETEENKDVNIIRKAVPNKSRTDVNEAVEDKA